MVGDAGEAEEHRDEVEGGQSPVGVDGGGGDVPAHPGGAEGRAGEGRDDGEGARRLRRPGRDQARMAATMSSRKVIGVMAEALVRMSRSNSSVEARSIWLRDMLAMALIMLFSSKDFFDCFV